MKNLKEKLEGVDIDIYLTAIVRLSDLTEENRSAEIASLLSSTLFTKVYLVFLSNIEPRREFSDSEELKGAMKLIKYLEDSGIQVTVGFSSSDLILWKAAGAKNCASGKYFNLRRFTPSRWEPSAGGGGQLPYWFEESTMAYLREPDLQRLRTSRMLDPNNSRNPFSSQILRVLDAEEGEAWLALSWKQYLYWFSDFERRIDNNGFNINNFLKERERVWRDLDENDILFDELHNDGSWLRRWRKAIVEFD